MYKSNTYTFLFNGRKGIIRKTILSQSFVCVNMSELVSFGDSFDLHQHVLVCPSVRPLNLDVSLSSKWFQVPFSEVTSIDPFISYVRKLRIRY